jgi:outer membrane lipopolysaccharide assembly protein LptE/RlpB
LQKSIFFSLIFLFLTGCGYKPTTEYTTPLLGNKIKTEVDIDIKNPSDSIYLKDALNESVVNDYNAKLNDKNSTSDIKLKVNSTSISAIDYDENGYPILYRANASITAYVRDIKNVITTYSTSGSYDFATTANSVLDDNAKHNAIKEAFIQALKIIEFKIAGKEMSNDNKSNK